MENNITALNLKEKLNLFFDKFPLLQKNYCEKCLEILSIKNELLKYDKKIDPYLMDTGICDKCGETNDLINPLIYSVAKSKNLFIWGISPRLFRLDNKYNDRLNNKCNDESKSMSKSWLSL